MVAHLLARPHIRFMTDAMLGLAVFCALTFALLGPSSAAGMPAPMTAMSALSAPVAVSLQPNLVMLGAVFSTLFALNLSFVRHLATAYRRANRRLPTRR